MFFSVRTKLLTAVGAIVLIALALNTLVNSYVFQQQYSRAVHAHAFTLGRGLDAQLQYLLRLGIPLSELVGFDKQCQEVVAVNKDVAYAMLLALDGTVLFHSHEEAPRKQYSDAPDLLAALQAGEEAVLLNGPGSHYDAIVPVLGAEGTPIAAVVVGIPMLAIGERVSQLVAAASVIGSLSLVLALAVLLIVIGRLVVRPLGVLDQSIQAITSDGGRGSERPPQVDVRSSDEFGNIARAFNHMSKTLDNKDRALRKHIDKLEQQGRALEMAVSEANAANLAKSQFLANMSHELRTPMNSVIGMVELVQEGSLSAEQREMLDTALHSGESLLAIINDVLDFSKIEANKLQLDNIAFDLPQSLEQTLTLLSQCAHRKGLELLGRIAPEVPPGIMGDPSRLRQVLTNLIANAIKFTDQGKVLVEVERLNTEPQTGQPCRLQFTVRDTGCGIKAEDQAHLFNAFSQADNSLTRRYGGTGLGLAICRQLVELMGGEIGVDSEPGKGSVFWFTMPLTIAPDIKLPEQAQTKSAVDSGSVPAAVLQGRVLLAEDSQANRRVIQYMLTRLGLTVDAVVNGAEAVTACAAQDYDVILMDCQMPVLDGYSATRQMREAERNKLLPRRPVIGVTAHALAGDRERCLAAGMDDYLTKPIRKAQLAQILARWLPPQPGTFEQQMESAVIPARQAKA